MQSPRIYSSVLFFEPILSKFQVSTLNFRLSTFKFQLNIVRIFPEPSPNLPRSYSVPTPYLQRTLPEPCGLLPAYYPLATSLLSACLKKNGTIHNSESFSSFNFVHCQLKRILNFVLYSRIIHAELAYK